MTEVEHPIERRLFPFRHRRCANRWSGVDVLIMMPTVDLEQGAPRRRLKGRAGRRDWSTPNSDLRKVLLKLMGQCGPAHANETRTATRGISTWEGAVR